MEPITTGTLATSVELTSLSIEAFHAFKSMFDHRVEHRINKFLRNCYRLYLAGGKDAEKARIEFVKIINNHSKEFADGMADLVNRVIYNSSDLCAACYALLYMRLVNQDKDIFGTKGSSFENLAAEVIHGMNDRDIRFCLAAYKYVLENDSLLMDHQVLKLYGFSNADITTFLTKHSDLSLTFEGFIVLINDLIRRRIFIPDPVSGRLDGPFGFGLGKYSKDFHDLFVEANEFILGV
ncbi:MAG: hypothetical protein PHW12_00350 [Smithella sp.]|nr:hypothetical protein [Smithella sp.]